MLYINLHFAQKIRNPTPLLAVIAYLDQAIDEKHINLNQAITFVTDVIKFKTTAWINEKFNQLVRNLSPLVKNCTKTEEMFFENVEEICSKIVLESYAEESSVKKEIKNNLESKFRSEFISAYGSSEYSRNKYELDKLINEKTDEFIQEHIDEIRANRCLPQTNREQFIKNKTK